jgi:hypothetical protein
VWATAHPQVTYQRKVGGEELPERFVHDPDSLELRLGQGTFEPVTSEVREYQVGGQNVLDGWLSRTGSPSRRAVSELDRIRPDRWQPEWSRELQRVLAVLSHLVDLQPTQDDLLDRVLVSPLISVAELERRSVFPVPKSARRSAPAPVQPDDLPGTEGIEPREPHAVRPLTTQQDTPAAAPTPRPRRSRKPASTRPRKAKPKDT